MIPLSVPCLMGNEMNYIADAVLNGWVSTAGGYVKQLEHNMSKYLGTNGAVVLQSGTAAMHLALILAGVTHEDEVVVPTLTFIAAVNPVKYIGAEPVFMDCDDTLNIDCDKLEDFLIKECIKTSTGLQNKLTKKIIKAIIVVHVFGNMAQMERLRALADEYDIKLIEDTTEALGTYYLKGTYQEQFAGTIGDFGAYSFNGNKIITTGGGGMLIAKDIRLLEKGRYLSTQAKDDALSYVHNEIGYNYRMTNMQAALGVAQLEKLEEYIEIKAKNYHYYEKALKEMEGYKLLKFNDKARNNYWFYSLFLQKDSVNRDDLMSRLRENQIETRPIWKLNHTQKMYLNNQNYYIEKAFHYWKNVINIPCSVNLSTEDMDYVVQILKG
ncbi:LegC family aminotransferase [Lachnotalea glycerini]|uniref:LegC family aminotransferase n=1 Tax=Lachnotalea glycerini TaxID=1763509 RepID=A0A371JGL9_9FIRM|nr:LegC family aminotransferase [Lachnotalea glycerini]RDY31891.1 LegC family aminotransferase [Lachnotalea glycerini]